MTSNKLDFQQLSIDKVKNIWHLYLLGEHPELLEAELNDLPESFLMIGTGRHEFYQTKNDFLAGMSKDQLEARSIQFELQDEWYEVKEISDTVCVVYGSIWAREKVSTGQTAFVDMQGSRFTAICKHTDKGVELCSIHHSMPYADQGSDEYYPKTLATIAKELQHKVELDRMTNFYSRFYMENHVSQVMKNRSGYFLILDLDNFKNINDTKGHLIGDQVLVELAKTLRRIASPNALLGRMGGDEFAIWDFDIQSKSEIEEKFEELMNDCKKISKKIGMPVSCSAGVAYSLRGTKNFASVYSQADKALYRAKSLGKMQLHYSDDDVI